MATTLSSRRQGVSAWRDNTIYHNRYASLAPAAKQRSGGGIISSTSPTSTYISVSM
ncbi:hypothetical protein AVEN_61114-1, partial [Araneus ventricosus]